MAALRQGLRVIAACALAVAAPALARVNLQVSKAPDHVLVWSQAPGQAEEVFRSLGFTVRDGQVFPEGISTSTVVFADWSFLELLHFSDPARAAGNEQAERELAFVNAGPGANSFAIEVRDLDATAEALRQVGFLLKETPDTVDPDGPDGPLPSEPAGWRDFHFADSPVVGVDMFFIEYPPEPPGSPEAAELFRARTTHANRARRLSALWVLVPDVDAEAEAYRRIGFAISEPSQVAELGGSARVASLASGAVVLVEAAHLPDNYRVAGRVGARVIGLSFEVASLSSAQEAVASSRALQAFDGPLGPSLMAQTSQELGIFLAFHEPLQAGR